MQPFFKRPGFHRFRIIFRRCRMTAWSIIFVLVAAIAYLHLVGLPDFLKRPLLGRLLAKGVAAQFSNLQLGWFRGPSILIENAAFSRADQPLSPRLSARDAELAMNWNAMLHGRLALQSLQVVGAELQLPISETNGDELALTNVDVDMRFYSNDLVRLDDCRGIFHGIQLDVLGEVTHAGGLRSWKFPGGGGAPSTNGAAQARMRALAQTLNKIQFAGMPLLRIEAGADGNDMNSFHAELNFAAAAAVTPWGSFTKASIEAACARLSNPGDRPFLEMSGSLEEVISPLVRGSSINLSSTFSRGANSNLEAEVRLDAEHLETASNAGGSNWIGANRLSWTGSANLVSSNFLFLGANGKLNAADFRSPWGSTGETSLDYRVARAHDAPLPNASWGPWAAFAPWILDCDADVHNLTSPKLRFDHLAFSGHWRGPQVVVENLKGDLYDGHANARATLDIASRELRADGVTDFDPLSVSQLFARPVREWLAQLEFGAAPKVNAHVRVALPPWRDRPPGWSADVDSSLQIAGDFTAGDSSFQRIPVLKASGHVTYTNRVWHVAGLHVARPDGEVDLDYISSPVAFHYLIDSHMNPKAALPLVAPHQPHLLDDVAFSDPPEIHAEIWGRWHEDNRLGVAGTVRATNVIAHGEKIAALSGRADYTNLVLTVSGLSLSNAQGHAQAPELRLDFGTQLVKVTNASGSIEPVVLQTILDNPPSWLNAVHFDTPPFVNVSGSFSLTNPMAADLRFLINGQRLHYTNLLADHISGEVDWIGQKAVLTNIAANLYNNGTLNGWLIFGGRPDFSSDFHANFIVREIDLASLVTQLTGKPTHVEGRLDGNLDLTGPDTANPDIQQGSGNVYVHNALLWDIKLFGLLSPVLNAIYPGWGHSRVRQALGTFVITNGTISSDDLELRCQGFVLHLRGKLDKDMKINARLEAVVSKEAPVIGPFLSFFLTPLSKLFEYRITGPVSDPTLEPVYIPKVFTFLLHPFHTLKSIAAPAPSPPKTAPP